MKMMEKLGHPFSISLPLSYHTPSIILLSDKLRETRTEGKARRGAASFS
jgi:hypothetical protein